MPTTKIKTNPSNLKKAPAAVRDKVNEEDAITVTKLSGGVLRYKDSEGNTLADVEVDDVMSPVGDLYDYLKES